MEEPVINLVELRTRAASHSLVAIIALVLGALLFFGVSKCRDNDDTKDIAVMNERKRVTDSVIAAKDSQNAVLERQLNLALANGTKIVTQWRESAPQPLRTGTAHDSVTQLTQQVRACRQVGDSLVASVVEIRTSCTAYRDTAKKEIAALKTGIAQRDTLLRLKSKEKRVETYAEPLYDVINRRPVFRIGTTVKTLFSIRATVEGEYAIPSAVKSESGDGLRVLAGARIRF